MRKLSHAARVQSFARQSLIWKRKDVIERQKFELKISATSTRTPQTPSVGFGTANTWQHLCDGPSATDPTTDELEAKMLQG